MSRQVFMTFFGRYRFADVRPEEIAEVWDGRITTAEGALEEAEAGIGSAEEGIAKAEEKLAKAQEKLEQRQNEMAEVDQSDDKATDKATKNLEKANDGVVKAQTSVDEVVASVEDARTFVMEARLDVESIAKAAASGGDDLDSVSEADLPDAVRARREYHPHESPWQMTVPLVVLAGAAIVAGAMNLPFSSDLHFLGDWLKPSTFGNEAHLSSGGGTLWVLAIIAVAGGIVGIAAAVAIYLKGRYPAEKVELPILEQAWRYDETISNFMGGPGRRGFDFVAWFDTTFIDGAVNGVGRLVREGGGQLRRLQTGLVRSYAALVAVGAIGLLAWFLTRTTI
jgi:NADH:ubiquinone oxidoreductase subunit 5 (subunit L)/multisubunit Na+/H+ antiporter MnhA subunit